MQTSPIGLELIKHFEGWRSKLYACAAGHATIGYGHLVHRGRPDGYEPEEFRSGISIELGTYLLTLDVREAERAVRELVTVKLTQEQFDALVGWTYNLGRGALTRSTLLKKLNAGFYGEVPRQMQRWVKAGPTGRKRTLAGLVRRRKAESELWGVT